MTCSPRPFPDNTQALDAPTPIARFSVQGYQNVNNHLVSITPLCYDFIAFELMLFSAIAISFNFHFL